MVEGHWAQGHAGYPCLTQISETVHFSQLGERVHCILIILHLCLIIKTLKITFGKVFLFHSQEKYVINIELVYVI